MHIHVGSNASGYAPEGTFCFDSVSDALEALRHGLKDQQDYYSDLCPGPLDDDMTCECDWCDVATDVEVALSDIAEGDAAYHMRAGQGRLYLFCPPEGPSVAHWATLADGDRNACEIAQEQGE